MALLVSERTQEIGVRMAIGATPAAIGRMVIANAGRATAAGTIVGSGGSLLAGHAIQSMLFGVRANDPLSLAAAAFILGAVSLIAAWLPARRAAAVDPMTALRAE